MAWSSASSCLCVLISISLIVTSAQLRRNLGPSVVVVLPPGLEANKTNTLSVAVNGDGEIHVKVFDASILLQHVTVLAVSGSPTKMTIGPFLVSPSSFILRVDVRSSQGAIFYTNTFHLQKISAAGETYLETDKPIYRPMETVRFRVLPLTSAYQINTAPVVVLFKNPVGLVVWKEILSSNQQNPFAKSSFTLPQHLAEGRWKVLVKDQSTETVLSEKGFDVLHYELPKFEILVVPNISFYTSGNENVNVVVLARLATGRQLTGTVMLLCSAEHQHEVTLQTIQLEDGMANISFNLRKCWSPSLNEPPKLIQIRAEVRDYGSGVKHFTAVQMTQHAKPYIVKLLPLKPGLIIGRGDWNYSAPCLITVMHPNGRPAKAVPVQATVDCIQQRNWVQRLHITVPTGNTNDNGELLFPFSYREECSALMITVVTKDDQLSDDQQSSTSLLMPLFISDATGALGVNTYEMKVGDTMEIKVHSPLFSTIGTTWRILAFSEFNILDHFVVNNRVVRFPIRSEMMPEFAMILYHVSNYSSIAIVDDVLRVFASSSCRQTDVTLKVGHPLKSGQSLFHPGSNVTIFLGAKPGAFVATKAIDRKLKQLVKHPLEQPVFKDSKGKDTFRRLFENQTMDGFDFEMRKNKTVDICCSAGRVWWQLKADCPGLPPTRFPYLEDCRRFFISCCSGTELPRAGPACQRGQPDCRLVLASAGSLLPRMYMPKGMRAFSTFDDGETNEDDIAIVRSYFPEVWLFDEFSFGYGSRLEQSVVLPHSITNWTITGHFWLGANAPMCRAETEVGIDLSVYMEIDLPSIVFVGDQMLAKVVVYNFYHSSKELSLNITKPRGLCTASASVDWHVKSNASSSSAITVPLEFLRSGRFEIAFTLTELVGHNRHRQLDQVIKVIHAQEREMIDSSLDYNFSWDLSTGDSAQKWTNDSILAYKFARVRDHNSSSITASIYLTAEAIDILKINKLIARFTPLPAAKRARWSKLRLPSDTWRSVVTASTLNEVLIRAPSILQAVEDSGEMESTVPNPLLVEANQMLHLCLMESLSFRNYDGSYSRYRVKDSTSSVSLWLTSMATALHCRTVADTTVVCPSLGWITTQQHGDGSFASSDSSDYTSLNSADDNKVILTSFVLLTLRVCSNYGTKCWTDEGKRQYSVFTKALGFLAKVDQKKSDPLALGSLTLAFAAWKHPFARPVNDALLKLLEEGSNYPYWTYKPQLGNWMQRVQHGTKGWFSTEYRRKMLSSQIALNAMALLAQITLGNPVGLNLEEIGLWLIEHRKRNGIFVRTLDTILASRALIELHRSLTESDSNIVTKISVQCENIGGCPSVLITPQNAELTQTLNLNVESRGLTFLVTGRGAVYVKFQLIGKPPLRTPNYYPVSLLANTSSDTGSNFSHELCFQTSDNTMTSLVIEHTFSSGLTYYNGSFSKTRGAASVSLVEPTSHSVHILYTDVPTNQSQCYAFWTRAQNNVIFSLRRPIVARHPSLGVVGMTVPAGQNQGAQVPLLEKYCPPNSTECFCAEALCPPPEGECGRMICNEGHVTNLLKALCNTNYTGCLVKVSDVEEEKVGATGYKRVITSRHLPLTPNPSEEDCKNLDVLIRKSCQCPSILKNHIYVVVVRKDALLETTLRDFRPTVLLGEHGFFEPYFACSANRHSDIHKFVQENQRQAICANLA